MKKILISALVLVLGATAVSAQSPWFLEGNLGFNYSKLGDAKGTTFTIRPGVGYMFNDRWGVTLDLGFGYAKTETPTTTGTTTTIVEAKETTFGAGVGVVYMQPIVEKFFYAPNFRFGYERAKEAKMNTIAANLNLLRFEFRASCHWAFTANFGGLSFQNNSWKDVDDSRNTFGINIGRETQVGFKYYF